MTNDSPVPRQILDYYGSGGERDRLSSGAGLLELLRTQPDRRARLLDDLAFTDHEPEMLGATSHIIAIAARDDREEADTK